MQLRWSVLMNRSHFNRCHGLCIALVMVAALWLPTGTRAQGQEAKAAREAAAWSERYAPPALRFAPCAQNPALECSTLPVPINYRQPWLGHVDLAVIRAKATQPSRRIGTLFGIPGGPGGSGVGLVLGGANAASFKRLNERFDIMSFDVRGSHRSQALFCDEPTRPGLNAAALDEYGKAVARACAVPLAPWVTSMSSNTIALDMDVLRRALGEDQLSIAAISAGTVVGAIYASVFPQRVRALLLDAAWLPLFRDGRVEMRMEQDLWFEMVFQRLDQLCRADPACRLHNTGVVKALVDLKARLAQTPVQGPGGVLLTADNAGRALNRSLSDEAQWPRAVDALADALDGNHALMLQFLGAAGVDQGPAGKLQAFHFIRCNDIGTRRAAAEVLPVSQALQAVSNHMSIASGLATEVARCSAWPAADLPIIRNLQAFNVPVLLIGAHFDPNTPLVWTRVLATLLGMERNLLRYEGGGHGSYLMRGNTCIDQLGDAFLFELKLPPEGHSCPPMPIVFKPAASASQTLR
jgi:pimeloyl-ACP methyl ester carboxylesterase